MKDQGAELKFLWKLLSTWERCEAWLSLPLRSTSQPKEMLRGVEEEQILLAFISH